MKTQAAERGQNLLKGLVFTIVAGLLMNYLVNNTGVMTICAGVALFLFAMLLLEMSFKKLSGGMLETFLGFVADKNWKSFIFGFSLTTLVQSSGLVTVIAVSFLSAGLITLASGVALVYGVNLSSACAAWIMAYFGLQANISHYAMPLLILGVFFHLLKSRRLQGLGSLFLALGFLFLGISWMKEGFSEYGAVFNFSRYARDGMLGVLLCAGIGFLATAVTQSSHATITLAITALTVGQIDYVSAVGVGIGATVGSTIFTVIGSLNANLEGKKLAVVHVFFHLLVAALALVFFDQYLAVTDWIAPYMDVSSDDAVYKLAIFLSILNLLGVVLLTPFISQMCKALNRFVRSRRDDATGIDRPRYLNKDSLVYAETAVDALEQEVGHLLDNTMEIVAKMIGMDIASIRNEVPARELVDCYQVPESVEFEQLYQMRFKPLYSEIVRFAVRATSSGGVSDRHLERLNELRLACILMASVVKSASQLQPNMMSLGYYSSNADIHGQYAHIRRNMVRLIRFVDSLRAVKRPENIRLMNRLLLENKKKFNALSSRSLDALIRTGRISDEVGTSIMNDNVLARGISERLHQVARILTGSEERLDHEPS